MHTNNLLSNNQAFNGIYRGRLLQKSKNDIRVFIPGIYNSQIKEFDLEGMIDCFPKIQWCAYNLESIDINNQDNDGKGPAMIMFENGDLQRPVVLSYVVIGGGSENQSGYYNENGNLVSGGNYTGNGTTGNANADETFKWLIYYGLNIAQAAGVMGSLRCEGAAFDPKDKHMDVNGYYSYGIAKFNSKPGYPWDQVKEFCRNNNLDPYSIKGQCAAIVHTIKKGIFGNRLVIVNGSKTRNLSSILQEGNTIEGAINSCRIFFVNYSMFVYTFKLHSNIWITYILFTSVFYYLIFKAKLFNYHYLSIIIILLLGFIIDIIKKNYEKDWKLSKIGFIFSIVRVILLSFNYVIIKYTIDKKFASPYEIGFWSGIIDLILFIIFAILDYNFFEWNTYFNYFNEINFYEILYILGLIITNFFVFTLCLVIDKNNTPCHIFIMFIFGQIVYDASHIDEPFYVIIIIIFLIIILFFSLVFNEIIELNFCGLSRNTKRNMANRAKDEIMESNFIKKQALQGEDDIKLIEDNSKELNPIINEG